MEWSDEMDQQKLTLFLDLTETLNYTETAERNFMTQGFRNILTQTIA
jgi:hypothetical protein